MMQGVLSNGSWGFGVGRWLGRHLMSMTIAVDNRSLPLIIRRTARQKSIGVELTCRHEVIVRVPHYLSEAAISEVVNKCLPWLRKKLLSLPPTAAGPVFLASGSEVLVLGEVKRLVVEQGVLPGGGGVVVHNAELVVALPALPEAEREAAVRGALARWYRTKAAEVIGALVEHYSAVLKVSPPPFSITSARRRWGSCGTTGRLNFAWRLAMALPELIEYVVVHELCHLRRRDHSRAFWAQVAAVLPDYRERRQQLREHGLRYDM